MFCIICQDSVQYSWTYTNCNCSDNYYHINCLDSWIKQSNSCPTCRKDFTKKETNIETHANNCISHLDNILRAMFLDSIGRYREF